MLLSQSEVLQELNSMREMFQGRMTTTRALVSAGLLTDESAKYEQDYCERKMAVLDACFDAISTGPSDKRFRIKPPSWLKPRTRSTMEQQSLTAVADGEN